MTPMARPIAGLLPQQGAMVLLDEVVSFDADGIACRATSHRDPANPLRSDDRLPIWSAVEYAAQAMAAHQSLLAPAGPRPAIGLLGALREVETRAERLDDIDSPLLIRAERLAGDGAGSIYAFIVIAEGDGRELMRGRATVVQRAGAAP
jgi:predicted hotdog family 3-hydroxylacyl-ACP dehydratase